MIALKEPSRRIYLVTLLGACALHLGLFWMAGLIVGRSEPPVLEKELPSMNVGLEALPSIVEESPVESPLEMNESTLSEDSAAQYQEVDSTLSEPTDVRGQAQVDSPAVDWDWAHVDQPVANHHYGDWIELPPRPPQGGKNGPSPAQANKGFLGKASGTSSGGGQRASGMASGEGKSSARYRRQPLSYPSDARQRGEEGTVLVRVTINEKGEPIEVALHKSSGFSSLDSAAIQSVKSGWSFYPAKQGDVPVSSKTLVPVVFKLKK